MEVNNISADGTTASIVAKSMELNATPWKRQKTKKMEEPEAVLVAIVASS